MTDNNLGDTVITFVDELKEIINIVRDSVDKFINFLIKNTDNIADLIKNFFDIFITLFEEINKFSQFLPAIIYFSLIIPVIWIVMKFVSVF